MFLNFFKTFRTFSGTFIFSGIIEGSTIYLDGTSAGTADAEGTVRFSATDAGTYMFRFYKYTYAIEAIGIVATDEYLYDNITG